MNETARSKVGFSLLIVWMAATVLMGKNVDLATVVIASYHISHTQVVLLILLTLTVSSWRDLFLARGLHGLPVFYFAYLLLGLYAIALGYFNGSAVKYVLGSAGIFYYSLFFYIAFILINSDSRRYIFLLAIFYSWAIGALIFIVDFALRGNGRLPFGMHLSSDLLPMIAGCLVILSVALSRIRNKILGCRYISIIALLFLLMVNSKSVIVATILLLVYVIYKSYAHRGKARYFAILEHKFGFLFLMLSLAGLLEIFLVQLDAASIEGCIKSIPLSEIEQRNILIRLYMWKDISGQIISGPIWGHGFIPFNSDLITHRVLNLSEWSQNINPHNSYLNLAYFVGWFGLAIFLLLIHRVHLITYCHGGLGGLSTTIIFYVAGSVFMLSALATPVFEEPWLAPFMWILMGVACRQAIAKQTDQAIIADSIWLKEK